MPRLRGHWVGIHDSCRPEWGCRGEVVPPSRSVNPYSDPSWRRAFDLVFNGLGEAMTDDWWMPLSERVRVTRAICDALWNGGMVVKSRDDLSAASAMLRRYADDQREHQRRGF